MFGNLFMFFLIIIPILFIGIFIFSLTMMFSPKMKEKMIKKQLNSIKHITNFSKEELEDFNTNSINNMMSKNEETIKNIMKNYK